jgi:uncharacterized protein
MPESDAPHATALISLAVKPEHDAAHAAWQREIYAAAASFPGFLGIEPIPPTKGIQEHWLTILRFDSAEHLRNWLESPERHTLLEKGRPFFAAPPAVQRIAGGTARTHPISVVFSHKVKPGRENAFADCHKRLRQAMEKFHGFEAFESFPPVPGFQEEWVVIARFQDSTSLDTWLESPIRAEYLARLKEFSEGVDVKRVRTGFDAWFSLAPPSSGTAPWKQALAVLFALYPTLLVMGATFRPVLEHHIPLPVALLAATSITVAFLNWLAMPWTNRLLRSYLRHTTPRTTVAFTAGIFLWLAAWSVTWIVLFSNETG